MGGTEDDGKFIRGNIARIRVKLENIKAKRMSNTLDGTFLFNPGGKNQEGEEERKIFRGIWIKLQIVVLCEIQLKRIVQRYRMIGQLTSDLFFRDRNSTIENFLVTRLCFIHSRFLRDLELTADETFKILKIVSEFEKFRVFKMFTIFVI